MRWIVVIALAVLGCGKRPVHDYDWVCEEKTQEARRDMIVKCLEGANPKSDEEPEDWIDKCAQMATANYCKKVSSFFYHDNRTWDEHRTPCTEARTNEEKEVCGIPVVRGGVYLPKTEKPPAKPKPKKKAVCDCKKWKDAAKKADFEWHMCQKSIEIANGMIGRCGVFDDKGWTVAWPKLGGHYEVLVKDTILVRKDHRGKMMFENPIGWLGDELPVGSTQVPIIWGKRLHD